MHAALAGRARRRDRRVDPGGAGDAGDDRTGPRGARRQELGAQAPDGRQRRDGLHPAGARRLRRDLAARGSSVGVVARGDGLARLGRRSALRHQARPRRQLGCAACADVGMEPPARQAVDRRHRAGGACAELSAARAGGAARLAAARASRLLRATPTVDGQHGQGAGLTVRADASRRAIGLRPRRIGAAAAVRRSRARFQLGDRRARRRHATSRRWVPRSSRSRRRAAAIPAARRSCTRCSVRRSGASCST